MATRSVLSSRSVLFRLTTDSSSSRSSFRFFSDGRVLGDEERAAENVYIKKMEREKQEKHKLKEQKEKAEKEKAEKKP